MYISIERLRYREYVVKKLCLRGVNYLPEIAPSNDAIVVSIGGESLMRLLNWDNDTINALDLGQKVTMLNWGGIHNFFFISFVLQRENGYLVNTHRDFEDELETCLRSS